MKISVENSKANRESLNRHETNDDAEARKDFWSIQGDFIYRHHIEPRVQLFVPKETFPIPLKYIDVTRATHTNLDVLQEKRIDCFWNVDANRSLSDSWKGFTKFTLLKEEPPYVVREEGDVALPASKSEPVPVSHVTVTARQILRQLHWP